MGTLMVRWTVDWWAGWALTVALLAAIHLPPTLLLRAVLRRALLH